MGCHCKIKYERLCFIFLIVLIASCSSNIDADSKKISNNEKTEIQNNQPFLIPSLKIISPQNGQIVNGHVVSIGVSAFNFSIVPIGSAVREGEGHFHVWLDGSRKIGANNVFVFENVTSGAHEIAAELVRSDHSSLSPRAMASIKIIVESGFVPEAIEQKPGVDEYNVIADDKNFYPEKISAKINDTVRINFRFNDDSIYFAGLDVKGPFPTIQYKLKGRQPITAEFTMKENTRIDSYWPSSGVHKATLVVDAER